ncbi:hypothetical protein AAHE18_11G091000 [Arachis hypogaea]
MQNKNKGQKFKIKGLGKKVANKNEDEFYFKMIKTKTVDGVYKLEY